ncbi:MAG: helix-turn-helix domain-containing protein, partial [Hyphomicrobiaceae bacterium]
QSRSKARTAGSSSTTRMRVDVASLGIALVTFSRLSARLHNLTKFYFRRIKQRQLEPIIPVHQSFLNFRRWGIVMLATAYGAEAQHYSEMRDSGRPTLNRQAGLDERFAVAPKHVLKAREHLYCEGDAANFVYRVEIGHICIYRIMPDGRRQVVDFAYPGDVIGLGALQQHNNSAHAMERTTVRVLPLVPLREIARTDSLLSLDLYEALSMELLATRELLFTVSQRTATERVSGFLKSLSRRSERSSGNALEFVLPMTRLDIADFLGLTIETVSRTLTRLRSAKVIDLEQSILVTIRNLKSLEALSEGVSLANLEASVAGEDGVE